MINETFNVSLAVKAQKDYWKSNGLPNFAPRNGVCWNCNKNIYEQHEKRYGGDVKGFVTGISVEKAGSELVTGCPHCNRSYCD